MADVILFPDVPVKCSSGCSASSSPLQTLQQGLPMLSLSPSGQLLSRRPNLSCWPGVSAHFVLLRYRVDIPWSVFPAPP